MCLCLHARGREVCWRQKQGPESSEARLITGGFDLADISAGNQTATFKHWATSLGPEPWLSRLSFLTTWMESNQKAFLLGTKVSKDSIYATDLQAELPAWVIEHHFILKCLADKLYSFTLGDLTGIFSFLKNERSKSVTSRRTTGSTGCQW